MPTFTSNLLYVKNVTNDLNYNVIFSPNDTCFQDIKTSLLLGKCVSKGEFYLLEDTKLISDLFCAFKFVSVQLVCVMTCQIRSPSFLCFRFDATCGGCQAISVDAILSH